MFKFSVVCAILLSLGHVKAFPVNDGVNTIVTSFTAEHGLHYVHVLNPKETVYSLSKFSGTTVKEIYDVNHLTKQSILSIGQELVIPVHPESVITDSRTVSNQNTGLIKVMYKVKKKDNLFQIAKRHFSTDINTIIRRNNLSGLTISPDQLLHIGWISLDKNLIVRINKDTPTANAVNQQIKTYPNSHVETTSSTVSERSVEKTDHVTSVSQTATQVISQTIDNVNDESSETTPQYRVVQHTPLHKKEETKTVENASESTTVTTPNEQVASTAQVMPHTDVRATTEVPVSDAEIEEIPITIATNESPIKSNTPVASPPATDISDNSVKSRDYPDLSFLSSPNLLTQRGIAMWDKHDNEPLNMFILHHDAKIGSYIRIENPMLGRIVLAKVVARLPTNVYDQDVKMVVSTAVANSLGVKDSRFLAEMKYIRL